MTPIRPPFTSPSTLATVLAAARRRSVTVPLRALVLVPVLVLGGCASMEQPAVTPEQAPPVPGATRPDGSVRVDTEDARIAQLWSAAEQSVLQGQPDAALEHLYAALELDKENALLWSRAAELQLDREEAAVAETFAARSNAFSADNAALQHRNWLIIEHARTMRGDLLGTRSAHRRVQQYQYQ